METRDDDLSEDDISKYEIKVFARTIEFILLSVLIRSSCKFQKKLIHFNLVFEINKGWKWGKEKKNIQIYMKNLKLGEKKHN